MRTARLFRENTNKLRVTVQRFYGDILPSSEVVIIKKKKDKNENVNLKNVKVSKKENIKKEEKKEEHNIRSSNSEEFRVNEVNIQMISRNIYEQLFKKPSQKVDPQVIKR